ncbi:hypothetical protein L1987_43305 [Smallanthus sonchifolius]|uniref:Uncharacterized protein n=1 Tax=Smallanthus sonchifolius TaxID=185202 RepID=A0ACB9GM96_9ASTR|nr:hypothetical protein L1987_43305 [Smallanthus sonchifolius]
MWTCTFSAPDITIALVNMDGLLLYHGYLQSSHVIANNTSNSGTVVHFKLGDLNLVAYIKDYSRICQKGIGLVQPNQKSVLSVDVIGIGMCLTFTRVQSLLSTALLFKTFLKNPSSSPPIKASSSTQIEAVKPSGKRIQLVKFNLQQCCVNLCGDVSLDDEYVDDPKRVNYGSQGGRFLISELPDRTPRTAKVASTEYKQRPNVVLFDMQKAKFVKRAGGLKEVAICSLFSVTTITARWEPDVHLALVELGLRLKLLVHNHKLQEQQLTKDHEIKKEPSNQKKKESLFVVDVEMLTVTAEAGDGVETIIQLSRIPNGSKPAVKWDYVIQGLDMHICLPFRLQLRAIDDYVEEMIRALKLVADAKKKIIFPFKKESESKKPSSTELGRVKLYVRKLTAEIEEEPLQGWLDEHYHLRKKDAHEMAARSLVVQLRDYSYPLLVATSGKCEGRLVLAQQATPFQPQTLHEVYIGKWRKVDMYRSVSGTTPPMKMFLDLPLHFEKVEVSFGVGFEPPLADLSYAFTVALRRASLSVRNPNPFIIPPKIEKSFPWWDEMRNYIHGNTTLSFSEMLYNILATTDPYEKSDKFHMSSGYMEIQQSDGRFYASSRELKIFTSSLENLLRNSTTKPPAGELCAFLVAPTLILEVAMDWGCDSGTPLNHFLFALPSEGVAREYISDPFRSTSLSMRLNLALRTSTSSTNDSPTINVAPHDIVWLINFIILNYIPPVKLRFFSRYPRFGVPRVSRSGNLSLDKVMTEFILRVDSTPTVIRHMSLDESDPAKGLTFKMSKIKSEMYLGRGKQKFTFDSPRDLLVPVYQGVDLHMPKVFLNKDDTTCVIKVQTPKKASQDGVVNDNCSNAIGTTDRIRDDGFILSSDYFIVRKQSPKADCSRLLTWQEACKKSIEMKFVIPASCGHDNDELDRSDPSDDDGYNVVIADNSQRVFVYGLKLLLTIENRNGILSWGSELGKAVTPPKPSPSRQHAQRKLLEETQDQNKSQPIQDVSKTPTGQTGSPINQKEASKSDQSQSNPNKVEHQTFDDTAKHVNVDGSEEDEEGTCNFMVNVIEPQFNLHSEEANGRFLLAAASGRVLSRSFHKVVNVGIDVIEQANKSGTQVLKVALPHHHVYLHYKWQT